MTSISFILLLVVLCGTQSANSKLATRRQSLNETFFNGSFSLCKGSRVQNPVELVHAHVFATKLFRATGIRTLVDFFTKYKIPSYSLYPLCDKICLFVLILYSFLSESSVMILPRNATGEVCVNTTLYLLKGLQKSTPFFTLKHGGKKFILPWQTVMELARIYVPLIVKVGNGNFPRDGNHLLHTVDHFRQILL